MIFAAGLGTRLRPFTLHHPKALVPVNGVPMLRVVADRLIESGVDHLIINVHHFADQIVDYVNKTDFGIRVNISDESEMLLDTGGGILAARKWLEGDEPFIVHNADILSNLDIRQMYDRHIESERLATLLVSDRKTSRYLYFDRDNLMRGWGNVADSIYRPAGFVPGDDVTRLAFDGVHVLSPRIFDLLESYNHGVPFSIMPFYVDVCREHRIGAYVPDSDFKWFDVGRPETLEAARNYFLTND